MVGLSTQVTSNSIKIDLTPPEPVKHMRGGSSNSDGACNALFDGCNGDTSGDLSHFIRAFFSLEKVNVSFIYMNY
jgi:hypothetical protein